MDGYTYDDDGCDAPRRVVPLFVILFSLVGVGIDSSFILQYTRPITKHICSHQPSRSFSRTHCNASGRSSFRPDTYGAQFCAVLTFLAYVRPFRWLPTCAQPEGDWPSRRPSSNRLPEPHNRGAVGSLCLMHNQIHGNARTKNLAWVVCASPTGYGLTALICTNSNSSLLSSPLLPPTHHDAPSQRALRL